MRKTILITGSTDGIGKLTAIKLAKAGHTLYLHGRSAKKLSQVITEVKTISNNQNIDGFVADFSNLKAVEQMARDVEDKLEKLDVLINNAGVFKSSFNHTNYGDIRMVVNYLAPYVLTSHLLSLLEKGEDSRIINLSSAAQASVSLNALKGEEAVSINNAYTQSKLALTMWSFYLAKQVNHTTVIAVNPGSLLNTRMVQEAYGQYWAPATKGAGILYNLAVSEEYRGITGKYYDNDKGSFNLAHQDAYNEGLIEELITETQLIQASL